MTEPVPPEMQSLLGAIPEEPLAAFVLADDLEEQDDSGRRLQGNCCGWFIV